MLVGALLPLEPLMSAEWYGSFALQQSALSWHFCYSLRYYLRCGLQSPALERWRELLCHPKDRRLRSRLKGRLKPGRALAGPERDGSKVPQGPK